MDERKFYKCELCGADVLAELVHLHKVNGTSHAFCSAEHVVEWIELDEAVARDPSAERLGDHVAGPRGADH
jgi:hypothetical protein